MAVTTEPWPNLIGRFDMKTNSTFILAALVFLLNACSGGDTVTNYVPNDGTGGSDAGSNGTYATTVTGGSNGTGGSSAATGGNAATGGSSSTGGTSGIILPVGCVAGTLGCGCVTNTARLCESGLECDSVPVSSVYPYGAGCFPIRN